MEFQFTKTGSLGRHLEARVPSECLSISEHSLVIYLFIYQIFIDFCEWSPMSGSGNKERNRYRKLLRNELSRGERHINIKTNLHNCLILCLLVK